MCTCDSDTEINAGYLSPIEAARYLSISVKQLEHLCRRGGGPRFCKVGRLCRYPMTELDSWMGEHLVGSTCEEPAT